MPVIELKLSCACLRLQACASNVTHCSPVAASKSSQIVINGTKLTRP